MGIRSFFGKIWDGLKSPFVLNTLKHVIAKIPVVGLALSIALDFVIKAEETFVEPGSGDERLAWVLERLPKALEDAGLEVKNLRAIIEIALLLMKNEASVEAS
jgi:hypothetical protein